MCYKLNVPLTFLILFAFNLSGPTPALSIVVRNETWRLFPTKFLIGVGSSSYQIEGGTKDGGRGESVIDRFITESQQCSEGNKMKDRFESADTSSDEYHHIEEDVKLLKQLGVDFYRFSISWSRILPTGSIRNINQIGIEYYDRLIDLLLKNNIQPFVTMFHWEYPETLQGLGGFTNPVIINYFVDYARLLFKTYGDKVEWWATFNEPRVFSVSAYAFGGWDHGTLAPGVNIPGIAEYLSVHHILLSHSEVYHMYDKEFRSQQNGKIGISLATDFFKPQTKQDEAALERILQFRAGWLANPIFGSGDYPAIMREVIDENSAKEGRTESRLPRFTDQQIESIKGSADFLGVNYYSSQIVVDKPPDFPVPSYGADVGVSNHIDPDSEVDGVAFTPEGLRLLLNWLKDEYDNPIMFITESGCGQNGDESFAELLNDDIRIKYLQDYLEELLKAVNIDKVNVIGYSAWSFLDSFEWVWGYSVKYGLHHVDFSDPNRTRTAKKSAAYYNQILSKRCVLDPEVPDVVQQNRSQARAASGGQRWGSLKVMTFFSVSFVVWRAVE